MRQGTWKAIYDVGSNKHGSEILRSNHSSVVAVCALGMEVKRSEQKERKRDTG